MPAASAFVEAELPAGRFDVVGHSMGGLVARTYALGEGGDERIGRMISAGSPWRGSVQVFQLLQNGFGLGNGLLGGIEGFRRTVVSFPSMYELMPAYDDCCGGAFDAASREAWAGLNWTGIDVNRQPDLAEAGERQAELQQIFEQELPASIEDALVIGVDQRTPEQYEITPGAGEAKLAVRTSWDGDGTVLRDSAQLPGRVIYRTSFATHDAILNDASVQDFVLTALREGPAAAARKVPVRPRSEVLTALGQVVELVGVAIEPDRPVYAAGDTAQLVVHLRPAVRDALDPAALQLTVQSPGSGPMVLPLIPAPQASDPANPFEQSFAARVPVGMRSGQMAVSVTVDGPGADARRATRLVPVLAR